MPAKFFLYSFHILKKAIKANHKITLKPICKKKWNMRSHWRMQFFFAFFCWKVFLIRSTIGFKVINQLWFFCLFFPKRYADIFDLIICILSFIKLIDDFFFDKTNHEVCFSLCRAFQQARFVVMNYYQNPFSFGIASCQSKQPTFYISISQKLTNIQLLV